MSVTNYIKGCNYSIGKLKDYIYLVTNSSNIEFNIDNGSVNITDIENSTIHKLYCNDTLLSNNEDDIFDKRYKFNSTLTFSINELMSDPQFELLDTIRNNKYHIVVEDNMGTQYMINVDYPSEISYEYIYSTQNDNTNVCNITYKSLTNLPMMILNKSILDINVIELNDDECKYNKGGITSLRLINKNNLLYDIKDKYEYINLTTLNNDKFSLIDFNKNSFIFTHKYENNIFNDTIEFSIPLSSYKYSFHYNLIEFLDNKYIALFTSKFNLNNILSGNDYGYFPSFTITSSEDNSTEDIITIKLSHTSGTPLLYNKEDIPPKPEDVIIYVPKDTVKDNYGKVYLATECIDKSQAKRLVLQESTLTGNLLDRYWVLEGYEERFKFLNIVGTYTLSDDMGVPLIVNSSICSSSGECTIYKGLPSSILFTTFNEQKKYTILTSCDWNIITLPTGIKCDITSGLANVETEITLTNTITPNSLGERLLIVFKCCLTETETIATVVKPSGWIFPTNFNINANEVILESYLQNILQNQIEIVDNFGLKIDINSGIVRYSIPFNHDELPRTYTVLIKNKVNDEIVTITINQDILYKRWVVMPKDYICKDGDSYEKERKYIGYTANDINIPTEEYREGRLIKEGDERCNVVSYRWVDSGNFGCQNNDKYIIESEEKQIGVDGEWIATGVTRFGGLVESNSDWCINPPIPIQYNWILTDKFECGNL